MKKEIIAVVFDTETTGLIKPEIVDIKKQPQIIEFYGMKIIQRSDGVMEQIDELETFLKPEMVISDEITRITGITNDMVRNAPSFPDMFNTIAKFHLGVDRWVAHNLAFDSAMLANELSRIGRVLRFPFPLDHICTVQKSMYIEQRRISLTNLHKELFGVEFAGAHRAKDDVQALFRCYKELVRRGKIK